MRGLPGRRSWSGPGFGLLAAQSGAVPQHGAGCCRPRLGLARPALGPARADQRPDRPGPHPPGLVAVRAPLPGPVREVLAGFLDPGGRRRPAGPDPPLPVRGPLCRQHPDLLAPAGPGDPRACCPSAPWPGVRRHPPCHHHGPADPALAARQRDGPARSSSAARSSSPACLSTCWSLLAPASARPVGLGCVGPPSPWSRGLRRWRCQLLLGVRQGALARPRQAASSASGSRTTSSSPCPSSRRF